MEVDPDSCVWLENASAWEKHLHLSWGFLTLNHTDTEIRRKETSLGESKQHWSFWKILISEADVSQKHNTLHKQLMLEICVELIVVLICVILLSVIVCNCDSIGIRSF